MALFAKVVEHSGFSAAARALDLQKSLVSRRINALEKHLGLRLIERNTRHFKLTDTGELYYPHCARLVAEAGEARDTIAEIRDHPQGELRISASVAVGQVLLSPLLAGFMKVNPDVIVNLQLTNTRIELIDERYDVVFRVGQLEDSTLIARKVYEAQIGLYASPGYLARNPAPRKPADLADHAVLQMSDIPAPTQLRLERKASVETLDIKPRAMINDFWALRHIAERDGGIALIPDYLYEFGKSRYTLEPVLKEWSLPTTDIYLIHTSRTGNTPKVRAFLEYISTAFDQAG